MDDALLGSAVPTRKDERRAVAVAALLIVAFVLTAPVASVRLAAVPAIISAYDAAVVILDLITALLLYGQYRELGERSFLALACGYVFASLAAAVHALSFPDVFVAGSLIGGGEASVWLWMVWHGVFPLFIAAYALLVRRDRARRWESTEAARRGVWAIAGTLGLATLAILLTTAGEALLPELMLGHDYKSSVTRLILSTAWVANVGAFTLLLWVTHGRRLIDLWLAVTLLASIIDLALSAILVDGRYQVGFYAGRFYGLLASTFVLVLLLRQAVGLHGGLTRTAAEREAARAALAGQSRFLEVTLSSIPDLVYAFDRNRRFVYANRATLELFGHTASEMLGRNFLDLDLPPDLAARLDRHIDRIFRTGATIEDEVFYTSPTGASAYFQFLWGPMRNADRSVELVVGVSRDTTERRAMEDQLRASKARLQAASDLIGLSSYTWDPATGALEWDARQKAMWGLPVDAEVDYDRWLTAIHPEDRPRVEAAVAACTDPAGDGVYRVEYRVIGVEDGIERWVSTYGRTSFVDRRPVGFIGAVIEITERKRVEERLRASEERLRRVLETEAVAVLFFNHDGVLIDANDVFLRMTGYSREEVNHRRLHWRTMTPPEYVAESEAQIDRLATGCIGPYEKEYLRKDGSRSWMLFTGRDLGDGTIVEFGVDISDRKRAEEIQRTLIAELQHRTRNLLAVVRSAVSQTIKTSGSLEDFRALLEERLAALSRVQGLLSRSGGHSVPLRELLTGELLAHGARLDGRTSVEGPDVLLPSRSVQILALALHELATNASRYGALAQEQARLDVTWELNGDGARFVTIHWAETGVHMPKGGRRGFGSYLIARALPYELEAETSLSFTPDGVRCELLLPLDEESVR